MRSAQRILLIILLFGSIFMGTIFTYAERAERIHVQVEKLQIEQFLKKVSRSKCVTYEDIRILFEQLNYTGEYEEIRMEIYQKEQYWFLSWEEIQKILLQETGLVLEAGNIICIFGEKKTITPKTFYYEVVSGKG